MPEFTTRINLETPADFAASRQALAENTASAVRATVAQETALMQRVRESVPRYATANGYRVANAMTKARRALIEHNRNGDEVAAWSYMPSDDEIVAWLREYAARRDHEDAETAPTLYTARAIKPTRRHLCRSCNTHACNTLATWRVRHRAHYEYYCEGCVDSRLNEIEQRHVIAHDGGGDG